MGNYIFWATVGFRRNFVGPQSGSDRISIQQLDLGRIFWGYSQTVTIVLSYSQMPVLMVRLGQIQADSDLSMVLNFRTDESVCTSSTVGKSLGF